MILGMSIETFTQLHVVVSLVGIAAGVIVALAMIRGEHLPVTTALFLATTVLTSATGFLFPNLTATPGVIIGAISMVLLGVAIFALYSQQLAGPWRSTYVVSALAALYLNILVLIVQAFQKLEILQPLALTQSEPPFLAAQGVALALTIVAGVIALKRFQPG
jgi:hypothetical protein